MAREIKTNSWTLIKCRRRRGRGRKTRRKNEKKRGKRGRRGEIKRRKGGEVNSKGLGK